METFNGFGIYPKYATVIREPWWWIGWYPSLCACLAAASRLGVIFRVRHGAPPEPLALVLSKAHAFNVFSKMKPALRTAEPLYARLMESCILNADFLAEEDPPLLIPPPTIIDLSMLYIDV